MSTTHLLNIGVVPLLLTVPHELQQLRRGVLQGLGGVGSVGEAPVEVLRQALQRRLPLPGRGPAQRRHRSTQGGAGVPNGRGLAARRTSCLERAKLERGKEKG